MMDTALGPDKDFWPIANRSTKTLKETSRFDQILTFIFVDPITKWSTENLCEHKNEVLHITKFLTYPVERSVSFLSGRTP